MEDEHLARTSPSAVRIEAVTPRNRDAFVEWAIAHGAEHDDSYTQELDLDMFPTPGEIAALAVSDNRTVGVASLMVDGFGESGLGRFRILHAARVEAYAALLEWVVARVPAAVRHVYLFLPDGSALGETLEQLGFVPTRYAVILERAPAPVPSVVAPPTGEIRRAEAEDAQAWAKVVNSAFAHEPGHYPMTAERAAEVLGDPRAIASFVAWCGSEPVGVSTVWRDDEEQGSAEVVTLGVVSSAQGQGFGRALLRRALAAAAEAGWPTASLSTGSANKPALTLYTSESFRVVDKKVCWGLDVAPRAEAG
ncbi:MAG: GNAT family N-acetyltransferase [Anaerosomatales bacterium]|nr:GNAT family N-acetyltransferase [Anaerosomatales bacterium]